MANEDRPTEREIRIARVLRPLGTRPMTRTEAVMAGKLLDLHWTSVYRLRRRFLGEPVASSVAPKLPGPRPGDKRVAAPVEQVITDVVARWLPKQRELAHPLLDTWMEIRRRCLHAALPAPGRNTVARRLVAVSYTHLDVYKRQGRARRRFRRKELPEADHDAQPTQAAGRVQ